MIMQYIQHHLQDVIKNVFGITAEVVLERPQEQFGDATTNVAMQLAGQLKKAPRAIAEEIVAAISHPAIAKSEVAGPGFINLTFSDSAVLDVASSAVKNRPDFYRGKTVVTEYSDANAFKQLHVGHLYTTIVGDVISNLIEAAGATVRRVNFGGDVGLHVAKAMWGIINAEGSEAQARSKVIAMAPLPADDRMAWISTCYRAGNMAYEQGDAKEDIVVLNKKIYQLLEENDTTSNLASIYWTCREWSYDYFKAFYRDLEVKPFDKYYPESQTAPIGLKVVREQLKNGVYSLSNGAVVFKGEEYGLHTRVFINSAGLPTYETKDVGVGMAKWQDYHFDQSIIITGNDIVEYMKVLLASIAQFEPQLAERTLHITHGQVKLEGGIKMSSRLGNGLNAVDILQAAEDATAEQQGAPNRRTAYSAVKYAFLKQRIGGDIIYIPKESVALEGNSGPYIQYAHARACSILAKSAAKPLITDRLDAYERPLARKISEYPEIIARATHEFMPHHICTYLYELAQTFNRFYEHSRVIGDSREAQRIKLVGLYADVLKDGLTLLGIDAPQKL